VPFVLHRAIRNVSAPSARCSGNEVTPALGRRVLATTASRRFTGSRPELPRLRPARVITLALRRRCQRLTSQEGLSGGQLIVAPPARRPPLPAEDNVIAGNVALYGLDQRRGVHRGGRVRALRRQNSAAPPRRRRRRHGCRVYRAVCCWSWTARPPFCRGHERRIAYGLDPAPRIRGGAISSWWSSSRSNRDDLAVVQDLNICSFTSN